MSAMTLAGLNPPTRTRRSSFADLSVNVKVLAAVATAAAVALVVGILGLVALSDASASAQLIYTSNVGSVKAVGQIRYYATQTRSDAANQALSTTAASTQSFADDVATDIKDFDATLTAYRGSNPAAPSALIDAMETNWNAYVDLVNNKMLPAGVRNDLDGWARIRTNETLPVLDKLYDQLTAMDTAENADAAKNAAAARSGYETSRNVSIVALVAGLVLALAIGAWWPARSCRR
ncbi:MCP four helix bundle domain-containing protein [Actinoplanes sp. NPDC026619]|uniref:MCP four helix bundle domain-containing protein n=1 Tax=Actinoplanes sp. NPDC026619 TaxID=3155798 RepID=UPI0033C0ACE7